MPLPLRVLLVESNQTMRRLLEAALEDAPDLELVRLAGWVAGAPPSHDPARDPAHERASDVDAGEAVDVAILGVDPPFCLGDEGFRRLAVELPRAAVVLFRPNTARAIQATAEYAGRCAQVVERPTLTGHVSAALRRLQESLLPAVRACRPEVESLV
jgi:chemotaxis response regulator CheB